MKMPAKRFRGLKYYREGNSYYVATYDRETGEVLIALIINRSRIQILKGILTAKNQKAERHE